MSRPRPTHSVVFLHGIGAGPASWDSQISQLPAGFTGRAPEISGLTEGGSSFSVVEAATRLAHELDRDGLEKVHLCGLSLGAVVATAFAAAYPERVLSLMLSGGQVHPNHLLMAAQNSVLRVLPAKLVSAPGMTKNRMIQVLREITHLDLRPVLGAITAPTLVVVGSKDRANHKAARELAAGIPNADFEIIPGAGHQWNTQIPKVFSSRLNNFLQHLPNPARGES